MFKGEQDHLLTLYLWVEQTFLVNSTSHSAYVVKVQSRIDCLNFSQHTLLGTKLDRYWVNIMFICL